MSTTEGLRAALSHACSEVAILFMSETIPKSRDEYFAKGKLGDNGKGAVYAYFDCQGTALYIGESSRPIKRRMHDQRSPHKSAEWWVRWEFVRFMQVHNRTDRLVLELLLILSLRPIFNAKPGPRELTKMFDNEIGPLW
jgi:hypothetical protein